MMSGVHRSPAGLTRWFQPAHADPDARVRLVLFPPAGGSGSVYRDWHTLFPVDITCQVVQLPGRLARRQEEAYTEISQLVEILLEVLDAELDGRPYAFFGHSMGAQLAYVLTQAIERDGGVNPVLLAASGWAPRGFAAPSLAFSQQPESTLIDWVRGVGLLPDEIAADPAMLALVIPALRADLALCASYVDEPAKVDCAVVTYSGRVDPLLSVGAMNSWTNRSDEYLGHITFPGGHFYIDAPDHALAIIADLHRHLRTRTTNPC
jgi:surfactin synthase thioesterase subunit